MDETERWEKIRNAHFTASAPLFQQQQKTQKCTWTAGTLSKGSSFQNFKAEESEIGKGETF